MLCVGVWNINVLLSSCTVCVCLAAIRWHLRCFHVRLGYLCFRACARSSCFIDRRWWNNDWIFLSRPSLSRLVSPSLAACHRCCSPRSPRGAAARSLSSCRVVWSVCAQPPVPAQLSPCVESMGGPKRPLRSTVLPCVGGEWALHPILLPFNLMLYHDWESKSYVLHHYFGILALFHMHLSF